MIKMQIAWITTALVGMTSAMHVHVRVHAPETTAITAAQWEQCHFHGNKTIECQDDLYCAIQSEYYGQCVDLEPKLWEQCGGKGWPSDVACQEGTCSFVSEWYSQCMPSHEHQHRSKYHRKHATDALVGEWGQCKWKDSHATCHKDLQCIVESEWYGQCRRNVAKVWGQCGGKSMHGPWTAQCADDSVCEKKDDWYSQCKPADQVSQHHGRQHYHHHHPTTAKAARVWDQCGGKGFHGPTQCQDGATCVRHNDWFSQCKPVQLPVGELCGQNDNGTNEWKYASCAHGATCQSTTATEYRCKH